MKIEVTTQSIFEEDDNNAIIDKLVQFTRTVRNDPNGKIKLAAYKYNNNILFQKIKESKAEIKLIFEPCAPGEGTGLNDFIKDLSSDQFRLSKTGKKHNHHKFILVETDNKKFVAQTSCNFKSTSRSNDLVIIQDDEIYNAYLEQWNRIWGSSLTICHDKQRKHFLNEKLDDTIDTDIDFDVTIQDYYEYVNADNSIKCIFSPMKKSKDPILHRYLSSGKVKDNWKFSILQSQFENKRGEQIAKQIVKLATDKKCSFQIMVSKYKNQSEESGGYLSKEVGKILKAAASDSRINVEFKIFKKNERNNHSKLVLIELPSGKKQILTGSHNFDKSSLTLNDEALLRINNADVYDQYKSYFDRLWRDGKFE